MYYTDLDPVLKTELDRKCTLDRTPSLNECKTDTAYFSYHFLGIRPYTWQYLLWKKLDRKVKRIILASGRQIGKSTALAVFALKAAMFNTFPAGLTDKTHIGIISATEEQSKKLMLEIRRLIHVGDDYVEKASNGKKKGFFSDKIDNSPEAANNKTTITFKNGDTITCLPPTDRVRGYSFSYVLVDEGAFFDDASIFFQCIEPTVSKTDGVIVITSTPNGQMGFFYDLFDPDDKLTAHEYDRLWIHYSCLDDLNQIKRIEEKRKFYQETGREKEFEQEHEAKFTAQVSAFFDSKDIDQAINLDLTPSEKESNGEMVLGLDFGMVNSNTVIAISKKIGMEYVLVYMYIYPPGADDTLFDDVSLLVDKFHVSKVVVDDCPEGYFMIQRFEKIGMPLIKMSFRTEKVEKYYSFRSLLRQKKIKIYKHDELIRQMKGMQQIETAVTTKIEKPQGSKDDCVDAFMMSLYPYLGEENTFYSENVVYPLSSRLTMNPRADIRGNQDIMLDLSELKEEMNLWRN